MATYYFDTNGATAGFGTLTGNWNPSTALWSANSAGTSATSAVTFTDVDIAQFGFAGTAGTAGTATITTGVTNTVNQVVTANLAGLQTIAAAGTGALALAGTIPTINVGSAGGLAISAPITGTAGFTKAGTGTLIISPSSGTNAGLTGTVSITGTGDLTVNTNFAGCLSGVTNYQIGTGSLIVANNPGTNSTSATFSGTGLVYMYGSGSTANTTFSNASALSGLTGTAAPGSAYGSNGVDITLNSTNTGSVVNMLDLPATLGITYRTGSAVVCSGTYNYTGTGHTAKNFYLNTSSTSTGLSTSTFTINANGTGPMVIDTVFSRYGVYTALTGTVTLSGTSSAGINNTVSAPITNSSGGGALGITKSGANKWIFSGTNTYTGANTVSAGTLVANNNSALGQASGTASSVATGATLEIASGITVNKASTQWTLNGNTAANGAVYAPSGNAGLTAANFVLGTATTDIKADAGATLTLTSNGAISATSVNFTLRHVGTGTAVLAQTAASTFTALNIQSGTVSVSAALAAGGASSGIGNGSTAASNWLIGSTATAGTFRYTGAASSTNRNFTIGTAGSTFDASGSGVLTLTGTTPAFSAANTACTLTLAGISGSVATPNTSAMVLADNGTGAVGLTKTGTGFWRFTASQTYTGATTITGGSMSFGETNIATNVVFDGPGTLREVVLNGVSKTITCSAGASDVAELISTSSHNTITGSTNVTTGTLKLTTEATAATKPVKVLGDTDVVVTSKLQTSTGILQRGQMRYGGNLTFQGGSTFIIGG